MSAVNRIPLAMSGIPFVALLPPFCGDHRSRRASTGQLKWEDLGKTVGIMLQICDPIFSTGKCVVLDSGFCVSKGITALL